MSNSNLVEGTLDGEELLIIHCNIIELLGEPGYTDIWIYREESINFIHSWLNKPVNLVVKGQESTDKRYYYGFVSECDFETIEEHYLKYRLRILPEFGFSQFKQDCCIYQNMTVIDIIKKKIDELGIADYKVVTDSQYNVIEYCTQYNETDLSFITRMIKEYGLYYYFEHNKNSCTIVFIDNNNCHYCLEKGAKFSLLMAKENVITPDKNTLRVWKNIARVKHNKNTSRKFDYLKPNAPYEVEKVSPLKHLANKEIYQYPTHNQAQSKSEFENEIVLQSSTQSEYFIGETASPHLCSGYIIKLEDHPQECLNDQYLITNIEYNITNASARSSDSNTSSMVCRFKATLKNNQFRLNKRVSKPNVSGVDTAIVVGPKGKEIYTDKLGRVKVQFHWDRIGRKDENSSCWIRVAQGWSGAGYGYVSIPRVNEEVIVSYELGNPDKPIITGRVYNPKMQLPYTLPENESISGWKTKSTPNGKGYNEFILDDSNGEELIRLKAENNLEINTLNDRNEKTNGYVNEEVKKDKSVTIYGNEERKTKGDMKHEVLGDMNHEILGEVNLKSKTKITLECSGSKISLGPEGINIKTMGIIKINGTLVKIN